MCCEDLERGLLWGPRVVDAWTREEYMPTGHRFPVSCGLLRKRIGGKWAPTLLAETNAVSWLDGNKKEEEVRRGLGKMGVETRKVTRDGDSYLVSLRGRIREETSERSRDNMTEMWTDYSLAVLHVLLTSFILGRNSNACDSAKMLQICLKEKLQG